MFRILLNIVYYFFPKDLTEKDIITKGDESWQNRRTGFYAAINYTRRFFPCFVIFLITIFVIYTFILIKVLHINGIEAISHLDNAFNLIISTTEFIGCFILATIIAPIVLSYFISSATMDKIIGKFSKNKNSTES